MYRPLSAVFAVVSTLSVAVFAAPSPLTPPTGAVGKTCTISWTPDTTGTWKETNIELMSGNNQAMTHVTTVATVDTTSAAPSTFTYPCPDVSPNSVVYFYQFSHSTEPTNLVWTTRFGISGATGQLATPQFATQPDGTAVPWGNGALTDPSKAEPAPTYIVGQSAATPGTAINSTASGTLSASLALNTTSALPILSLTTSSGFTTSTAPATSSAPALSASPAVQSRPPSSGAISFAPNMLFLATSALLLCFH